MAEKLGPICDRTLPMVSIGMPVWNGEPFVRDALDAVLRQDYPNIEIVVSDNGSTDATQDICRAIAAKDARVRYFRSDVNNGGSWNFNHVAELAQGDYFMWAAADDLLLPRYVSACMERLISRGEQAVLVCPRTKLIDAEGRVFDELGDSDLQADQPTPHARVYHILSRQASHLVYGVMRLASLRSTRGILPVVGDDVTLLTELACRGTIEVIPEQLFLQRRHTGQFSAKGRGQVGWFAPRARAGSGLPQTKLAIALMAAAFTNDLPLMERIRCSAAVLLGWILPKWRGIVGDFIALVRS